MAFTSIPAALRKPSLISPNPAKMDAPSYLIYLLRTGRRGWRLFGACVHESVPSVVKRAGQTTTAQTIACRVAVRPGLGRRVGRHHCAGDVLAGAGVVGQAAGYRFVRSTCE